MRKFFLAGAVALISANYAGAQTIEWEIKDRFRVLLTRGEDAQYARLDQEYYTNRLIQIVKQSSRGASTRKQGRYVPLIENAQNQRGLGRNWKTYWNEEARQYDLNWVHQQTRDVVVRVVGAAKDSMCRWSNLDHDVSCAPHTIRGLKLDSEKLISVTVKRKNSPEKKLPPVTIKPRDVLIAVIGDSYVSGEGNPHVPIGEIENSAFKYPAQWWDTRCHRSLLSSSAQASGFFAKSDPHQSVTYISYACSGAEIRDGLLTEYVGRQTVPQTIDMWSVPSESPAEIEAVRRLGGTPGQYREYEDRLPRQIDALADALCRPGTSCAQKRVPDILIIAIGGNDIGFGEIARDLITGDPPSDKDEHAVWEANHKKLIGDRFKQLSKDYKDLANEVRSRIAPARVFLSEYIDPSMYSDARNKDRFCGRSSRDRARTRYYGFKESFDNEYVGFHRPGQPADPQFTTFSYGRNNSLYNILLTKDEAYLAQWVVRGLNATVREASALDWVSGTNSKASVIQLQDLKGPNDRRRGLCAESSWFLTIFDSWNRQDWIPKDNTKKNRYALHLNSTDCPGDLEGDKCLVAPGPVTSGIMHPNFFGHYNIGQVMLRMIKAALDEK